MTTSHGLRHVDLVLVEPRRTALLPLVLPHHSVEEERKTLVRQLFPTEVPMMSHYQVLRVYNEP